jgi:hypothetical protein
LWLICVLNALGLLCFVTSVLFLGINRPGRVR